jgi:hypothetical protein
MDRKIRIATALALVLTGAIGVSVPATALAGSPLLSGYGGPGAGEQAILGSTLLKGPSGGSSSGGSSGSGGSSNSGSSTGTGATAADEAAPTRATGGSTPSSQGSKRAETTGHTGSSPLRQTDRKSLARAGASAYVYPTTLRLASDDTPVLGISGTNLIVLAGTIATLALLGVLTIRLGRLQDQRRPTDRETGSHSIP